MKFVIRKDKLIFIVLTVIIRALLDYIFINYISDKWRYQGFFLDIDTNKIITSYLALFFFIFILKEYRREKFSHFLVIAFFFIMYIPLGVVYGLMNMSSMFFIIVNLSFLLLSSIIILYNRELNIGERERIDLYPKLYWIINIVSIVTILLMTVQNVNNISLSSVLNLNNVYSVRENATYFWGMNYFFSWQTKIFNPYMIAINHIKKRKILKWLYILSQIWLYILTGHKMVLFTLIIVFIILKYSHKLNNLQLFFIKGLSFIVLLSAVEILVANKSYLVDFFIRRIMYIPALLSFYYYEFFNEHGFQFWKYTMFGRILNIKTDFQVDPSFIIGEKYFNNIDNNAVTGYLGSEYMNGGLIGVILATFILIFLFKKIDKLSDKIGKEVVLITLLTPIYTLWNSAMLTALLTGGVIIGLIILDKTTPIVKIEKLI